MTALLALLCLAVAPFQEGPPLSTVSAAPVPADASPAEAPPTGSARVEGLLARVHQMRLNLLLGGEKVLSAEKDATQFYRDKTESVDKRLDSVSAELTELRANYQVALESALRTPAPGTQTGEQHASPLREAMELRSRLASLEREQGELGERRTRLERLVQAVEARGREREKLAAKVDSEPSFDESMISPFGDVGLAPELEVLVPNSLLDDEGLVADLLAHDPLAAHRVLFEADPQGYWGLFPLQPPATALRVGLPFPPPDLPGQR